MAAVIVVTIGFLVIHPTNTTLVNNPSSLVKGTGPEISSPYLKVNGVTQWYYSIAMKAATTTLCSFQAPVGTSTLEYVAWDITQGTSTAATIDIGSSANPAGTTTDIVVGTSVASNAQGSILYSAGGTSTPAVSFNSNPASQFNQYLNVVTAGAGLAGYTYGGQCYAVFDSF